MSQIEPDVSGTIFDDKVARVAKNYAEALLNVAVKTGEAESVVGELEEIDHDLIQGNPRFASLFASVSIPSQEKDRFLSEAFDGRALPTVVRFLKVLNHHGRLGLIAPIAREARLQWDRKQNRKPVTVRSAVVLDENQRSVLQTKLAAMISATPVVRYEVNSSLIGGLVIQVGDDVYDASIKSKLEQMRKTLLAEKLKEIRAAMVV